jgi:sugar fermentation stimulation protein A
VKNVHLKRDGWAEFPDSVTARGAKHLSELSAQVAAGYRAVMVYIAQRNDCLGLRLAADLDPAYAQAFSQARAAGVEALALACAIDVGGIAVSGALPCQWPS